MSMADLYKNLTPGQIDILKKATYTEPEPKFEEPHLTYGFIKPPKIEPAPVPAIIPKAIGGQTYYPKTPTIGVQEPPATKYYTAPRGERIWEQYRPGIYDEVVKPVMPPPAPEFSGRIRRFEHKGDFWYTPFGQNLAKLYSDEPFWFESLIPTAQTPSITPRFGTPVVPGREQGIATWAYQTTKQEEERRLNYRSYTMAKMLENGVRPNFIPANVQEKWELTDEEMAALGYIRGESGWMKAELHPAPAEYEFTESGGNGYTPQVIGYYPGYSGGSRGRTSMPSGLVNWRV